MNESQIPPTPARDSAPHVPDFDLLRPIGEGGFGQVWLAVNRTTGQPRAVKVISLDRSGSRDPAGREIVSLTRLEANLRCRHPGLLAVDHVGQTAEHLFYVMDLADDVSGRPGAADAEYRPSTLESRLAAGPLSPEQGERCAGQLLAALACLHGAGMVHRDVKPANCLFVAGELKLADFGLLTTEDQHVSRLGTVRYMPPDGCMDARADVYAAGLVIYEMLSGLPADRFPSLGARGPDVARHPGLARLNRLALRACQPNPEDRFRDAREMLAALELGGAPAACRADTHRRVLAAVALLAATAVVAIGFWLKGPARIDVNFVTQPYEAVIYLDGRLLVDPQRNPYRTPCTVPRLVPRTYHVKLQWDGLEEFDAGLIDLAENREITIRRPDEP